MKRVFFICTLLILAGDISYAQQANLMLPIGHTNLLRSIRFSPDGKKVITSSSDNSVKIWDVVTGNLLANLYGHTSAILSSEFSPDGKKIVTGSDDHTAKIWDANTGKLLKALSEHHQAVFFACFSPANPNDPIGGKRILTTSADSTAKVWDAVTGKIITELKGHTDWVYSAQFSPDGKRIVTASKDRTARVWDALTGKLIYELTGHSSFVTSAQFSPASTNEPAGGRRIVTSSADKTARLWDADNGKLISELKGHTQWVSSAQFSNDGKKIITFSRDSTGRIWDGQSGKFIIELIGHHDRVLSAHFSPDNKRIVTSSKDKTAIIWDTESGKLIFQLHDHKNSVVSARFSPDGKKMATVSNDLTGKIWDVGSGRALIDFKGHTSWMYSAKFSPDRKKIVTACGDSTVKIWDAVTGNLIMSLKGHKNIVYAAEFSPSNSDDPTGGKKIVSASFDNTAKVWDVYSGKVIADLTAHTDTVISAHFSGDGKKVVTASYDGTAKVWDAASGKLINDLVGHAGKLNSASFNPSNPSDTSGSLKVITSSDDSTAKIWDAVSGNLIADLKGHSAQILWAEFSPDGKKAVTASMDNTAMIWNAVSGAKLFNLSGHREKLYEAHFSPPCVSDPFGGNMIVTVSNDSTAKIWDARSGKLLHDLSGHTNEVYNASFSPDGKKIVTASFDNTAKVWESASGKLLTTLTGHTNYVHSAEFSPPTQDDLQGGKKIITAGYDGTAAIWNAADGSLMYSFFGVDSSDYLVVDKFNHYDGTPGARKLLYYTCGMNIVELQQLKDRLWKQNLAERINKGEVINADKLSDLNICGLLPIVEPKKNKSAFLFKIIPGSEGLGETILYVNGIETKKFLPAQLNKVAGGYMLTVLKSDLTGYYKSGKENIVTVKAYTRGNDISSRGAGIEDDEEMVQGSPPNLYAVVIGVSDYKGDGIDLKFPDKDATDITNAISISAAKMLQKDHVFMYNLNTGASHFQLPEKQNIKNLFIEIGKKAQPNDILLIFFAGHGVIQGEKKLFYFLTADASAASISPTGVKNVGISSEELVEWMKPANIKAQKRILILDACNSGAAINQMVTIGNDKDYKAVRDVDKAEELKQIDRLNEKSGLYILSASASNQSAYELNRFDQGVLTYALLKAIKEHPEILESDRLLNVTNWFHKATGIVADIVRETQNRQEPQQLTTANFEIGIVDEEVVAKIILPEQKPLFASSSFQNDDPSITYDNLGISKVINGHLNEVSSRGIGVPITYITETDSPDAYTLSGRYQVKEDEILIKVNILKKKEGALLHKFEMTGKKNDIPALAKSVVEKALSLLEKKPLKH